VLWVAIASLQQSHPDLPIVVYTGDVDVGKQAILAKAKVRRVAEMPMAQAAQDRFGIALRAETIGFVYLTNRWLIEESTWPRFTLLGQSLGSVLLAFEALYKCTPSVFIGLSVRQSFFELTQCRHDGICLYLPSGPPPNLFSHPLIHALSDDQPGYDPARATKASGTHQPCSRCLFPCSLCWEASLLQTLC
jgi:hypothetical protein